MELLAESSMPDGTNLKLTRRTNEYIILANGKTLMSSRMHGSEDALAAQPRIAGAERRKAGVHRVCI